MSEFITSIIRLLAGIPREKKVQAVRLVRKLRAEKGERHGAVKRIADQLGYGVESVRSWVNQADVDEGVRPGTITEDAARIKKLEQENRELWRGNEILKRASGFPCGGRVRRLIGVVAQRSDADPTCQKDRERH